MPSFRIASFNVCSSLLDYSCCKGIAWDNTQNPITRKKVAIDVVLAMDADVVCLQETTFQQLIDLDVRLAPKGYKLIRGVTPWDIPAKCPVSEERWRTVCGGAFPMGHGWGMHNAIFYKHTRLEPRVEPHSVKLTRPRASDGKHGRAGAPDAPRNATVVVFEEPPAADDDDAPRAAFGIVNTHIYPRGHTSKHTASGDTPVMKLRSLLRSYIAETN